MLATAGSVMTIGLSINGCSHSKNMFDEGEHDWLVPKFGLRLPQRFDVIHIVPPFLLLTQKTIGGSARRVPDGFNFNFNFI